MASRKSERLVNLTILLLVSSRFVTRETIRQSIADYRDKEAAAFERMFERDKDELRELGIEIETGSNDVLFDDELGYRIRRQDYELPAVEFTPGEATVLGLATTVWQQASLARQADGALTKLQAAGIELDCNALNMLAPRLNFREPAFEPLWEALLARRVVHFGYRDAAEVRTVEPWRIAWRNNSWYLLGFDRVRSDSRIFKLSRISSALWASGPPGAFEIPGPDRLTGLLAKLEPAASKIVTTLAIRGDRAPALRRRGTRCAVPVALPDGYAAWQVPVSDQQPVAELASHGADVIVLAPENLRAAVLDHYAQIVETHGDAS